MKLKVIILVLILNSACTIAQENSAKYYLDKYYDFVKQNEHEDALDILTQGINKMPDSVSLYIARGGLLDFFQFYNEAINDFSVGIEKTDGKELKSVLFANRGGTKFKNRDFNGAYSDLIIAVKLDSTNINAYNNLAAVCDDVGKPNDVFKYLEKITSIDSSYSPAYVNLGFNYQRLGNHEKAISYFDEAIKLSPENALGYSNRSFSKMKLNDLEGALKDINHSIELMSVNSYAYKIRALIKLELGNKQNACKDLNIALEFGYTKQYGNEVNDLISKHCGNGQ